MKKYTYSFLLLTLVGLCIVPAINLTNRGVTAIVAGNSPLKIWQNLFNMDFALPHIGRIYYQAGVSLDPKSVIIGKSGWFFLGDQYNSTISVKRRTPTDIDENLAKNIITNSKEWESWFLSNGVKAYKIVIGPDKDSVYPEYLPYWAKPANFTITDLISSMDSGGIILYPKREIISSKPQFAAPLYFKTDTHWNIAGASIAFEQLMQSLSKSDKSLKWPAPTTMNDIILNERTGGDLSKFQRISEFIEDQKPDLIEPTYSQASIRLTEFGSGKLIPAAPNADVANVKIPTVVTSDKAINKMRVLWLRDSFGSAMAPFMAETFYETLQVHTTISTPDLVKKLTKSFKPDFVVMTTVERMARRDFLLRQP
ncbi:hypothetical protein NP554_20455 [Pseudomonas asiatica]|uniref:AlgX/AlgJ SGNH hydrolase-like domain-containing protein n=1 Tax=Pseudomonas asiatica TaxID=2219225 RepID=A0A9X4HYX7_9PSED|nr:hypothetical protein [Pseudomonas asiatica]MDD2114156.1 hypothetical protein [Pseudomonas asiatica]